MKLKAQEKATDTVRWRELKDERSPKSPNDEKTCRGASVTANNEIWLLETGAHAELVEARGTQTQRRWTRVTAHAVSVDDGKSIVVLARGLCGGLWWFWTVGLTGKGAAGVGTAVTM